MTYTGQHTIVLTKTWKTHTFELNMAHITNNKARFEFNLGDCPNTNVYFDNVYFSEVPKAKI